MRHGNIQTFESFDPPGRKPRWWPVDKEEVSANTYGKQLTAFRKSDVSRVAEVLSQSAPSFSEVTLFEKNLAGLKVASHPSMRFRVDSAIGASRPVVSSRDLVLGTSEILHPRLPTHLLNVWIQPHRQWLAIIKSDDDYFLVCLVPEVTPNKEYICDGVIGLAELLSAMLRQFVEERKGPNIMERGDLMITKYDNICLITQPAVASQKWVSAVTIGVWTTKGQPMFLSHRSGEVGMRIDPLRRPTADEMRQMAVAASAPENHSKMLDIERKTRIDIMQVLSGHLPQNKGGQE